MIIPKFINHKNVKYWLTTQKCCLCPFALQFAIGALLSETSLQVHIHTKFLFGKKTLQFI